MIQCDRCGGEIMYGQPHTLRVHGNQIIDVVFCEQCSLEHATQLWPEDWGPYPRPVHKPEGTC